MPGGGGDAAIIGGQSPAQDPLVTDPSLAPPNHSLFGARPRYLQMSLETNLEVEQPRPLGRWQELAVAD